MKWAPALVVLLGCAPRPARVGSKKFTESVILGELTTMLLRETGTPAVHVRELGGTIVLWRALLDGELDVYPEYTGTLCREILRCACDDDTIRRELARRHIEMTKPLGFRDEYVLASRPPLGLTKISDLARHPELRLGFTDEFLERADGWPALRRHYRLPQTNVRGLDHDLAVRGVRAGVLDVIDLYSTEPEVRELQLLDDDLHAFVHYDAVLLHRKKLTVLARLEGAVSQEDMIALNARARQLPAAEVAAQFLSTHLGIHATAPHDGLWARLGRRTVEHLLLVGVSLLAAILVGVPLGVVCARRRRAGKLILASTGVLQTIPSLALLVLMVPLLGIGVTPALLALSLYALLPIVRNTIAGLDGIAPLYQESAEALGLTGWEKLRLVELPLATPSIVAGIQTAAVIDVGTATLGALIGAGGYGQPILSGIRLDDARLILEGAIPAALLALATQALFALAERRVSRGSSD
jgi:osmoprotectant transport system permease protein